MLENIGNIGEKNSPTKWTGWDKTWVVESHRVPNMSAMTRLPW